MAIKSKLGTMTQITDLRSVWPNEALDFTPWLAENIDLLNEATGLSLEVVEQESPVGSFSLDILAQDTVTESYAVIENQLEDTDHDHLGKLLTYGAGKKAKYIIWVVKEAREEHKAAIEWLNSYTVEGFGFFLIEVQLWSIDGSSPAPRLNIVEQPNDWAKIIQQPSNSLNTAGAQFRYDYWTNFINYAFSNASFAKEFNKHKTSPDQWYSLRIGSSDAHINLLVKTQTNHIIIDLTIPDNKPLYDELFSHKDEIEKIIQSDLEWRRMDGKKSCRIVLKTKTDLKDSSKQPEQFEWFMKYARLFKKAFSQYL